MGVTYDPIARPEIANLLQIVGSILEESPESVAQQRSHCLNAEFKSFVTDVLVAHLEPIQQSIVRLRDDPSIVDRALARGAESARSIASLTLLDVYRALGLE